MLEVAFATLAQRFPDLSLAGTDDDVEWDFETFEGVLGLPVKAGSNPSIRSRS